MEVPPPSSFACSYTGIISKSQYCVFSTGMNMPSLSQKMQSLNFSTKNKEIFLMGCKILSVGDALPVFLTTVMYSSHHHIKNIYAHK